ncbi:HDOD domain-containing protein [Iodobacter fluviatilis]|uniref:HDOD domain n=1 Tax=Iodobacter fluviatilis TaxID=537 RepID=A0A377SXU8_9NEIS|nr:HDOD domain-containing protein [Iodobacter fluviatilis]TCU83000.1 HDOD domain-containing protein [Iodobacter fluviatilis]STR45823.1 HDOD domain [Iodobacter fluviatilis]
MLLEPVWNTENQWVALRAHADGAQLALLAPMLADSSLAKLPCLWESTDGLLPPDLPEPHPYVVLLNNNELALPSPQTSRRLLSAPSEDPGLICGITTLPSQLPPKAWLTGTWLLAPQKNDGRPNPSKPVLLELLGLITSDADTPAIESVIAKAPQLVFSLLRLVNSVAVGGGAHAESLRQAIAILGRRQLQRWLQLLLYAEQFGSDSGTPPLLLLAALRAKRLESWAGSDALPNLKPDAAFMAGMLSLLDRLFGQPLAEILNPLPLSPELSAGLLAAEGPIGNAIKALGAIEAADNTLLASLLPDTQSANWLQSEINACHWVRKLLASGDA